MTLNTANKDLQMTLSDLEARISYLSGFMLPQREQVLRSVLSYRTDYMTVCLENTFHSQNASALIRTCEAFGIQRVHAVESLCEFRPHVHIVRGTDKWIDIHPYGDTTSLLSDLRREGYRIVATTPHRGDVLPEEFDVSGGRFALFFGTEHAGLSEEVMSEADVFMRIPMCGFVESLNVSASASILLYVLSDRLRRSGVSWELSSPRREEILLRWMSETVRDSEGILRRGGF